MIWQMWMISKINIYCALEGMDKNCFSMHDDENRIKNSRNILEIPPLFFLKMRKSRVEKFITYIWNFPARFSAEFHRSENQTAKNNNNFPKNSPTEPELFALFFHILVHCTLSAFLKCALRKALCLVYHI